MNAKSVLIPVHNTFTLQKKCCWCLNRHTNNTFLKCINYTFTTLSIHFYYGGKNGR